MSGWNQELFDNIMSGISTAGNVASNVISSVGSAVGGAAANVNAGRNNTSVNYVSSEQKGSNLLLLGGFGVLVLLLLIFKK